MNNEHQLQIKDKNDITLKNTEMKESRPSYTMKIYLMLVYHFKINILYKLKYDKIVKNRMNENAAIAVNVTFVIFLCMKRIYLIIVRG